MYLVYKKLTPKSQFIHSRSQMRMQWPSHEFEKKARGKGIMLMIG